MFLKFHVDRIYFQSTTKKVSKPAEPNRHIPIGNSKALSIDMKIQLVIINGFINNIFASMSLPFILMHFKFL